MMARSFYGGVAALVALCVQGGFGFAWSAYDDYSMATRQLKLSSVVTSLAVRIGQGRRLV